MTEIAKLKDDRPGRQDERGSAAAQSKPCSGLPRCLSLQSLCLVLQLKTSAASLLPACGKEQACAQPQQDWHGLSNPDDKCEILQAHGWQKDCSDPSPSAWLMQPLHKLELEESAAVKFRGFECGRLQLQFRCLRI